ncbi:MAG: hypothetical protein QXO17_06045 [Nitrososphaerota archaeon]
MVCGFRRSLSELERAVVAHGYSSADARSAARELAQLILARPGGETDPTRQGHGIAWGGLPSDAGRSLVRMVAIREGRSKGEPAVLVTREELQRAARTLTHKPIDVDHLLFPIPIATMFEEVAEAYAVKWGIDVTSWCGVVLDAEEVDGAVEAIASVSDPSVMRLIRANAFRGVSVVEWSRSEFCTSGSGGTVCERRGLHFSAASLCLELEPAFDGTSVEPLDALPSGLLQLTKARSFVGLSAVKHPSPPTAIIGPDPEERGKCDHSELIALMDFRVPERVPSYLLNDLRRRLEREVSGCGHADVLALLDRPWPRVVSGELVSELLTRIRDRLSQSPGLNSPGVKEVVCCART